MFDKTFFKFALGFVAILAVSLAILYFVGNFSSSVEINTPIPNK